MTVSDQELAKAIRPFVARAFDGFDIDDVDVKSSKDHDGDPVLGVRIRLKPTDRRYAPDTTFSLASDIVNLLNQTGDARFPLIEVYYAAHDTEEDFYPQKSVRRASRK
jgi:hypothetical protein